MSREVGYGITNDWDDMVRDMEERALTTLEEDRRYHLHIAMLLQKEDRQARQAWSQDMDRNKEVHAELIAYRVEGHDRTRESEHAKDPELQDGPIDAGSSC
nr:hypothetical protein [Tanacetum cinerariifolium]